ncbi:CLUMA_CG020234, isoform A, partial [Clunio marinus]
LLGDNITSKSLIRPRHHNREETMDFSKRFDESSLMTSASVYGSQTNLSVVVKQKTDHLYQHFLSVIQARTNEMEVFETVFDLRHVLENTIDEMESNKNMKVGSDSWIRQEMNTWSLIHCLYKDRLITQKEDMETDDLPLVNSEKIVVEHLYINNSTLREHQLIVDWLEQTSSEQYEDQVAHYTDRSSMAWENTLHQLQNVGRTMFGSQREIVKSLDPDAPHREKLPLHDLDTEDQKRLTRHVFNAIRQGKVDEAQSLCEHCGQPWQAAILEGWRLFHDPNMDSSEGPKDIKMPVEGNPHRDLWKRCAFAMADNVSLDDYQRAISGSLCGHLESLLNVSSDNWWDLLWSYLKVQVDIRVESEIRSCCSKNYCSMPDKYWDGKISLEQIFTELDASKNINVKSTARSTMPMIQRFLILDDVTGLLNHMKDTLDSDTTPQTLRFFAHLVLFIRQIGRNHQEEIGDRIIRSYVQCLMKLGDAQLVAFYTAALPNTQQIQLYSEFLENISTTHRRQCLEEGQAHGLDVGQIAKVTVERIQNLMNPSDDGRLLTGEVSELDKKKISSLELLTFHSEQRGELLWQTNTMMRSFMAQRKIEAVKGAFAMVPPDTVQTLWQFYCGKNNLPTLIECSISEFLCHQTYIAAIDGYNDWIEFFYNKKPKAPKTVQERNFTEKVAREHQEQLYQQDLSRWKLTLSEQTNHTKNLLYDVLLFPQGHGWLADPEDLQLEFGSEDEANRYENRKFQMENLRKIHIPDIALLLHKILTLAEDHQECLKLVDEIASEKNQLYKVFSKHKMSELLGKVAESSLSLMNQKLDPFGYVANN